jgi:Tol biopolymer transport system component
VVSDVAGHQRLWASPLGGTPDSTFAFDDPAVRVDYPVWSPDGHWILFDRTKPEGGDIWLMERAR